MIEKEAEEFAKDFSEEAVGEQPDEFDLRIVESINQMRSERGLYPLEIEHRGCLLARAHSRRMAKAGGIFHERGVGAECVAMSGGDSDHVVDLWANSPPHYSIIMSRSAKKISVGRFGSWQTIRIR